MTQIHAVIAAHNRAELTLACLACLAAQTAPPAVTLVDDGSTDGTESRARETFQDKLALRILKGDGNLWWGGATYKGIKAVLASPDTGDNDLLCLMNDDITFGPDLCATALALHAKHPDALLHPLVVDDTERDTLLKAGTVMVSWALSLTQRPLEGLQLSVRHTFPEVTPVDMLRAQALFIPVAAARRLGNIAWPALVHYHGETEYTWRAKRAGHPLFICRDMEVYSAAEATGPFNAPGRGGTLRGFFRSLSDPGSPNNLEHKARFALLACPRRALVPFLAVDTVKVTVRSLAGLAMGRRIEGARHLLNRVFERIGEKKP
jgi:GT2 family glycosyltransferase